MTKNRRTKGKKSRKGGRVRDPRSPVSVWRSRELFRGEVVGTLTIILRTRGCRWNRCSMCGFAGEGLPVTSEDLVAQFDGSVRDLSPSDRIIKIYTSGSFLDRQEVPEDVRRHILNTLSRSEVDKLVIESRPEYVTRELVKECVESVDLEVGIGLETSDDLIREQIIRKGFNFRDFTQASEIVHGAGARVKAYLLLKPPLLSEGAAIADAIRSARDAGAYADVISLNLCNVQRGTPLERSWERGGYRPPWLWSALEVLGAVSSPIICDPVGAGSARGPHNCGRCDGTVAEAIRRHATEQDPTIFAELDCDCKASWEKVLELEEGSFGTPLV